MKTIPHRWYRTPRIVLEMNGAAYAHVDALTAKPGTMWLWYGAPETPPLLANSSRFVVDEPGYVLTVKL